MFCIFLLYPVIFLDWCWFMIDSLCYIKEIILPPPQIKRKALILLDSKENAILLSLTKKWKLWLYVSSVAAGVRQPFSLESPSAGIPACKARSVLVLCLEPPGLDCLSRMVHYFPKAAVKKHTYLMA